MAKPKDEKRSAGRKLDRRAVLASAPLLVGGLTALAHAATAAPSPDPTRTATAEREWARTLARSISDQLPEAARQLPNLCLTSDQIEELKRAFENTLVTNMGCGAPPGNSGE